MDCKGKIPSKSCMPYVCRHADLCRLYMLTDATQQRRFGTNIVHREQYYWQGFVSYSIAMAKLFLNSIIVTLSFSWSQYIGSCLSHPESFLHCYRPYLVEAYLPVFVTFLVVTMPLLVSILTSMHISSIYDTNISHLLSHVKR